MVWAVNGNLILKDIGTRGTGCAPSSSRVLFSLQELSLQLQIALISIVSTQRLKCSSFFVMNFFLLTDYNILPKRELPLSPWVAQSFCDIVLKGLQRV